ncbi:hypothetical protein ABIC30_006242 [Methylobacterium sp. 1030]
MASNTSPCIVIDLRLSRSVALKHAIGDRLGTQCPYVSDLVSTGSPSSARNSGDRFIPTPHGPKQEIISGPATWRSDVGYR